MQLLVPSSNPSDSEFRYLLESPKLEKERQLIENLWKIYKPYADKQFRTEFALNLHERFWEMYLTCTLITLQRYELIVKTWKEGPDICLIVGSARVWIEAIAPGCGEGQDAIVQPELENGQIQWFTPPEEKIILRYLNAISTKLDIYNTYLADNVIGKNEPYIVAINGRRVPFSNLDTDDAIPYIVKAVLPFGQLIGIVDYEANEIVDQIYTHRSEIAKANKSTVPTNSFLGGCSGITGILFSNSDWLNMPQVTGTEFTFIHNPFAKNRLPLGWLPIGDEYWVVDGKLQKKNWKK